MALRELATDPRYREVKIAVASTSLEPSYSRACMNEIEIVEGVTLRDMISYAQVGREGELTSRKTGHFRLIHEESGYIPYEEMLFFGKLVVGFDLTLARMECLTEILLVFDSATLVNFTYF